MREAVLRPMAEREGGPNPVAEGHGGGGPERETNREKVLCTASRDISSSEH